MSFGPVPASSHAFGRHLESNAEQPQPLTDAAVNVPREEKAADASVPDSMALVPADDGEIVASNTAAPSADPLLAPARQFLDSHLLVLALVLCFCRCTLGEPVLSLRAAQNTGQKDFEGNRQRHEQQQASPRIPGRRWKQRKE